MACAGVWTLMVCVLTLMVCVLSLPHITGSIISAAVSVEVLDQDGSEQVRFIHHYSNSFNL